MSTLTTGLKTYIITSRFGLIKRVVVDLVGLVGWSTVILMKHFTYLRHRMVWIQKCIWSLNTSQLFWPGLYAWFFLTLVLFKKLAHYCILLHWPTGSLLNLGFLGIYTYGNGIYTYGHCIQRDLIRHLFLFWVDGLWLCNLWMFVVFLCSPSSQHKLLSPNVVVLLTGE